MKKSTVTHERAQLNLFAFPSETDIRFLLLVLAIAGSTMILTVAIATIFTKSALIQFLCGLIVTFSLFVVARNHAQKSAINTIEANRWQTFPPMDTDPYLSASHQQMALYIKKTVDNVPELASEKIQFIWDETSKASRLPTGMAFGYSDQQYVCLRQGLHDAFVQFPKTPTFQSVLMHELGHIANRDVSKTIFTTSLGRCFFPIASIGILIFTAYTLWAVGDRLQQGISLTPTQPGIQEIISANIKLILLLLIVEIARSSILRVREYYADARARNWLGNTASLTQVLVTHAKKCSSASSTSRVKQQPQKTVIWHFFVQWFRDKIAPLHPTDRQRINRLENPRKMFEPSYELALLAGILSGISLNANTIYFSLLTEISNITGQLNQLGQIADESNLLIVLTILLFFVLMLLAIAIFFGVFIIFGLLPIVGTVGLQVQQAAFVDRFQPKQSRLLTSQKVIGLSLVLGLSFVLGCLLSPFVHALSMRSAVASIPWAGVLGLAIGWAVVFFVWIVSISKLAGNLYLKHIGSSIPHQKRRWLTRLSGVLLFPLFLWMCIVQILFGAQAFNPTLPSVPTLIFMSIILGVLAFSLYGVIWAIGWRIGTGRGWLTKSQCPHCQTQVENQSGLLKSCFNCGLPLAGWALLPEPVSFPSLNPLPAPSLTTAPPL